tara:strand:- start:976 stop:1719 length:744 start_codon:yes stop_codon:yes gene_type:complete
MFKDYLLSLLEVDQFNIRNNSAFRFWYNHIRNCANKRDGNIFEFGVYRGKSLIAAALILKELKSKKKIFGFDTFKGFPSYSIQDKLNNFKNSKYFTSKIFREHQKFINIKKFTTNLSKFDTSNISTSGNFSKTSLKLVKKKIDYFNLKNIEIIEGDFKKTVPKFFTSYKKKISSCNIDCDLFSGYNVILPFVYPLLTKGGHIHLDEYYSLKFPGPKIAVDDFCKKNKIKPKKNITRKGEFPRYYLTK